MKQSILIIVSVALSFFGIFLLFFFRPDVSPQYLQLSGNVTKVVQKDKVAFISFVPDDLLVVSFGDVPDAGSHVLTGRLQQYEGRVEFVVYSFD